MVAVCHNQRAARPCRRFALRKAGSGMPVSRSAALLCAGLAATAVVATTGVADAATSHGRPTVVVWATPHIASAPRSMHPGLVHVRNSGRHPVAIIKALHGASVDTLIREQHDATSRDFAVVDVLLAHQDIYARFTVGRYVVFDAALNNVTPSMAAPMRVAGAVRNAIMPPHGSVTISRGASLVHYTAPHGDRGYLRISNKSKHVQVMYTAPVRKSVSAAKLHRFLAHPTWRQFATIARTQQSKNIAIMWPGRAAIVHYSVPTGRNLIIDLRGDVKSFPGPIEGARAVTTP
jgi:hypothetical protein